MRIVQIAPNHETIPPQRDGGTERIVYDLSQELSRRGHDVILYAPHGSSISGTVIHYPFVGDYQISSYVRSTLPNNIDIIHDHTFESAMSEFTDLNIPMVHTIHLPVSNTVQFPVYVSHSAWETIGGRNGCYVHNGIVLEDYQFSYEKDDYLLFMGRIIREKGVVEAMDLAEASGQRLIIAGPIHDEELFLHVITPRLKQNPLLQYVGSVGGAVRQDLLKKAKCLLCPIQWEEPFGLVLIEAMACGTPVLALARGAAPEILEHFPGLLCGSLTEMFDKLIQNNYAYSPEELRNYVGNYFSVSRMTDDYLWVYNKAIN